MIANFTTSKFPRLRDADKNSTIHTESFKIYDFQSFKSKALAWADSEKIVCFLDNNGYENYPYHSQECLLAVGAKDELITHSDSFETLKKFYEEKKDWLFGFLTYDLKNEVERLDSNNIDNIQLPKLHFFQPRTVIQFDKNTVIIRSVENPFSVFQAIQHTIISTDKVQKSINLTPRISKKRYLETIDKIKNHIIEGDVYEMNFCQEFYAENAEINPLQIFNILNNKNKAPFSAYYKWNDTFVLSSSPERFLKKVGQKLISQPIKGTSKRSSNPKKDEQLRDELFRDEKNRAENVMIVDLVRNDLAKTCQFGTVEVEELFRIYTFEQVHQMISTVVGHLPKGKHFVDAIKNAFPMGSMTGAPKVMSMELIEEYEATKRGLYSGAIGYITPDGNFDFNVVIRSILYNAIQRYISVQVGGAIVYDSDAESEYEECLIKAKAMFESLRVTGLTN
ncbi:MAG: anthranilate synthase component I family protein [Saprospiraceae bacterium]